MKETLTSNLVNALERDKVVDISTLGRRSGQWRRIEIWFHYINGRVYLTGIPRPRGWYANILNSSAELFYFKTSLQLEFHAHGRVVRNLNKRREIPGCPQMEWYHQRSASKKAFINDAPLVEVIFASPGKAGGEEGARG